MKKIKYIIAATLLLGASYTNAQTSQYGCNDFWIGSTYYQICWYTTTATVNTPNLNPVAVLQWHSLDWGSTLVNNIRNGWMTYYGNRIGFEDDATAKYNCHSWAWAGGTTYWMNPPNQAGYWNDYSYVPSSFAIGAKVRYTNSDHSAIVVANSGNIYSSKWGSGPRFTHSANDQPYNATGVQYYNRPAIQGNDIVYYTGTSFNVSNVPGTIYWTSSNPSIITVGSSGNPVTATRVGTTTSGSTTLSAYSGSAGGTLLATRTVPAIALDLHGPTYVRCGDIAVYSMPQIPGASYSWSNTGPMVPDYPLSNYIRTYEVPLNTITGDDVIICVVTFSNGATKTCAKFVSIDCY